MRELLCAVKWRVRNVSCLQRRDCAESDTFEIGGFKWLLSTLLIASIESCDLRRLAIFHGTRNSCPAEIIRIAMLSCNNVTVCADVNLTVSRQKMPETTPLESTLCRLTND